MLSPGAPINFELDGQKLAELAWPGGPVPPARGGVAGVQRIALERIGDQWKVVTECDPTGKNPQRYGPLREAFNHRMLFVYATQGTPAENAWALAKARYDAESFGYRGNGSIEVIADTAYLAAPQRADQPGPGPARKRNVILYGHAEANAAWSSLLGSSPVQVRRGAIVVGSRTCRGEDLGALFIRPHPQDTTALVGVVAGSGLPGLRLTERLPVFLSGPGFPDCLVIESKMLHKGIDGVRMAGFFGLDWSVEHGEFVWSAE
jgi:hypothetical protein